MFKYLETEAPHLIPSYTGYCPQLKYNAGDPYARATHKVMSSPEYRHIYENFDSHCNPKDTGNDVIQIVNERAENDRDPLYRHPMLVGYTGHLPRYTTGDKKQVGRQFAIGVTHGLCDFFIDQNNRKTSNKNAIKENVPRANVSGQDLFRKDDDCPDFFKLRHAGHHPFAKAYIGMSNMEVTTKSRAHFSSKCLYENSIRCAPLLTIVE